MDRSYGDNVCVLFVVEALKVGEMLEVVGVDLAAFNGIVGDHVIGKFSNFKSDSFCFKNAFYNIFEDLGMGIGGRAYLDGRALERIIVHICVISVTGGCYCADNAAGIGLLNVVGNSLALKRGFKSKYLGGIFVSGLNGKNICVAQACLGGFIFDGKRVGFRLKTAVNCIV